MKTQDTNPACTFLIIVTLVILFSIPSKINAQINYALYFDQNTAQVSHYNPALTCNEEQFYGFPVISSVGAEIRSSFKFNDYVVKKEDVFYLSPNRLVSALDEKNFTSGNARIDLVYFGFRKRHNYFRFGVSSRIDMFTTYPANLVSFLLLGNSGFIGKTTDFRNTSCLLNIYHEYYISYTRNLTPNLSIGFTPKLLTGIANTWMPESNFTLQIDENTFEHHANADFNLNTSSDVQSYQYFKDQFNQIKWFPFSGNLGYSMDLGIAWTPIKNLEFSASMLDLGKIRWNKKVKNYSSKGQNTGSFNGLELDELFDKKHFLGASFSDMLTKFTGSFGMEESNEAYTAPLIPKTIVAASYRFYNRNKIGAMVCSEKVMGQTWNSFAVNFNRTIGKSLSVSVNYSSNYNNEISGVGAALVFQSDEFQMFIATNDVHGYLKPHDTHDFNLQFGISFVTTRTKKADIYTRSNYAE